MVPEIESSLPHLLPCGTDVETLHSANRILPISAMVSGTSSVSSKGITNSRTPVLFLIWIRSHRGASSIGEAGPKLQPGSVRNGDGASLRCRLCRGVTGAVWSGTSVSPAAVSRSVAVSVFAAGAAVTDDPVSSVSSCKVMAAGPSVLPVSSAATVMSSSGSFTST